MKRHLQEVIGFLMLASGAWFVLTIDNSNLAAFCSAGFVSILGLTLLLWSLGKRRLHRPRPQSMERQDGLTDLFRGPRADERGT